VIALNNIYTLLLVKSWFSLFPHSIDCETGF